MDAQAIISALGMRPHPEGGHYVETYRAPPAPSRSGGAEEALAPPWAGEPGPGAAPPPLGDGNRPGRGAVTAIHFLLTAGEVSAWHRIDATEIWHFAAGDPLVLTLSPNGHDAEAQRLGPEVLRGQRPHIVVPPGCWQTAETLGRWTLVSCIVAPAFDFAGFELAPPDWRPMPRTPS